MAWRAQLQTRRRFLQTLAAGTASVCFPATALVQERYRFEVELDQNSRWQIVDAVQQHLLPCESEAPGAHEIGALNYLKYILNKDPNKQWDRDFTLKGAGWLEDMAHQLIQASFLTLDETKREQVLRHIEKSEAGKNWLSMLLLYLIEALLADPVYGGNKDKIGWRWLAHIPGFPTPPAGKRYPELLQR